MFYAQELSQMAFGHSDRGAHTVCPTKGGEATVNLVAV